LEWSEAEKVRAEERLCLYLKREEAGLYRGIEQRMQRWKRRGCHMRE
jgi:hypothetical protein